MEWSAIAMILFSAVAVNHLGLIRAIEDTVGLLFGYSFRLPVVNCPKCLTFWSELAYGLLSGGYAVAVVAVALLCAYLATWLELLMGIIDKFYNYAYNAIYPTADTSADDEAGA